MSSRREILGTYDLEKKVEDTVILLDASNKFYGDPNIAVYIERGLIGLANAKFDLDDADRFALVAFGETVETILEFDDYSPAYFAEKIQEVEPLGIYAYLGEGIAIGLQLLIKELQRLSTGKLMRMLIVSDGNFHQLEKDWAGIIEDAKGIGIYADCIQVTSGYGSQGEVMRRIARITEGDYLEVDPRTFPNNAPSFAVKKRKASISQTEEDKGLPPALLEKIAAVLEPIDDKIKSPQDLLEIALAEGDKYKCGICFSDTCMICKGPSFACGAVCPQCGRFFHVHCASGWAENSKDTPHNVFKCPVCFYLLKVPGSLSRIKLLQNRLATNLQIEAKSREEKGYNAVMKVPQELQDGLTRACGYCHGLLNPGEEAYQCGNPDCLTVYHKGCYEKMAEEMGDHCRVCDYRMNLRFGAHPGISRVV